ncbi:MAG TPA: hypothetical protein DCX22_00590 [Dehalococcoidia bacterium]|nr:hypothetical protein [Dehalococcoidia bacterium]
MAIQRDRKSNSPKRGVGYTFLILIDILIVTFAYYLWTNDQIGKDIVAGVFIGVVILTILIMSNSDKSRR